MPDDERIVRVSDAVWQQIQHFAKEREETETMVLQNIFRIGLLVHAVKAKGERVLIEREGGRLTEIIWQKELDDA